MRLLLSKINQRTLLSLNQICLQKSQTLNASNSSVIGVNRLPIEHVKSVELNSDSFDSIIVIGNNLENDLKQHKLENSFNELAQIKSVHTEFEKDLTFTVVNNKRVV
jgi:hypothetical protein